MSILWIIRSTKIVNKQAEQLGRHALLKLRDKKGTDKRHCHLQKGRPTYVCCWEVINKKRKIIEVYYVGTHEKAPY